LNNKFWGIVTLIIVGFIFVAVLTHAAGFSAAAGSLFSGIQGIGSTLEAGSIKSGTSRRNS
jgi:hypothetical protein